MVVLPVPAPMRKIVQCDNVIRAAPVAHRSKPREPPDPAQRRGRRHPPPRRHRVALLRRSTGGEFIGTLARTATSHCFGSTRTVAQFFADWFAAVEQSIDATSWQNRRDYAAA